ncbi:MAG: tRNA-2-methylthio-N(6)-dimethylallyladenosine synthase [Candidatus Woesearchaeota archaeon]|nr:tRNA-2-methylthio-N(6)-dimethylallyladenosine synthase [Candidatus Woesearchaeota archaeon]
MKNVFIETYGCSANQNDTEIMAGLLKKDGFKLVDSIKEANIIVLNTCIVKQPTYHKMNHLILKYKDEFPSKNLIVAGCMPQVIDLDVSCVGPHNIENIVDAAKLVINGKVAKFTDKKYTEKINLPKHNKNQVIDIIQILEGCSGNCAYCIVKNVKPTLISFSKNRIVDDVRKACERGCREIWITSQDNGAYGLDKHDVSQLPELLREIIKVEGDFLVRVGMMNPNNILPVLDDLVEVFKNNKIFKFVHIPVQSGNDNVLEKMKRKYKVKDFKNIVDKFRQQIPDISISTDIICGFPGETEKQFQDSIELIKDIKPDHLNISKFGAMPGTAAKDMKQLDPKIINNRSAKLTKIFHKIALEENKKWIGWRGKILLDEIRRKGTVIGRNFAYKQVIVQGDENILGSFVNAKIVDCTGFYLIAEKSFTWIIP